MTGATAVDKELLSKASCLVARRMGLHFPEERFADLARGLETAGAELGFDDVGACVRWLASRELTCRQIEILASHLTVGETYFYRAPDSFKVLEQEILPSLVACRAVGGRTVRLWSAGCCTGEEAYSLAIACHRAIPALETWNVSVLATDINPRFLAKAAQGVFTTWSFRGSPEWLRERYFSAVGGRSFAIDASVRSLVHFAYLNLAEDAYPSLHNATNAVDVIFCRNVLMYFTQEHQRRVVAGLHRCLVDGGYLVVSAAEASSRLFPMFEQASAGTINFYGKTARTREGPVSSPAGEPRAPALAASEARPQAAAEPIGSEMRSAERDVASSKPAESQQRPDGLPLARARALADEGSLDAAITACEKAIAAERTNAVAHFLEATIYRELGRMDEAVVALKRVLYLEQDFILAHHALGEIYRRLGDAGRANRHFGITRELLAVRGKDEVVPESGGITCGRLLEAVRAMLEV